MSKKNNSDVAIIFDDLTEFFVMQPAIDDMKKSKIDVDIIVPYDSGYNGLAEHTLKKIEELGYSPIKDAPKNKIYQILLTPYPTFDIINRLNFIYHFKYSYGALSAKPNPTYLPEWKITYDCILSFNTYGSTLLSAYGAKCYTLPYWRYYNFKKSSSNSSKPTLLILPTFGHDTSSINLFTDSAIKAIKQQYRIIAKAHHATHFNSDADNSLKILQRLSDEFYDSDAQIDALLEKADIVLSDNSGAIFESICAGIPVALFAKDLNSRKLENIDTMQYTLAKKDILPYTNNPTKILPMLRSIDNYVPKQSAIQKQLFLKVKKDSVHEFTKIILNYLKSDPNEDHYKTLHDLMIKEWQKHELTIEDLNRKIDQKNTEINELTQSLNNLLNSTSWKITKPLRNIKELIKRKD